MPFGTIDQAISDLRNGKLIVVADEVDRENEGDLVCAAERCERLELYRQAGRNTDARRDPQGRRLHGPGARAAWVRRAPRSPLRDRGTARRLPKRDKLGHLFTY